MATEIIKPRSRRIKPKLSNYSETYENFSWKREAKALSGLPDKKGLNIAYEAVDRHAKNANRYRVALRWIGENGNRRLFMYEELREATNRFANVLQRLNIRSGEVVATVTGRIPELYITALGTLKHRSVYCPLFSTYGPDPIFQRLKLGKVRVLVTTEEFFQKKIVGLISRLDDLRYILITDIDVDRNDRVRSLPALMRRANPEFEIEPTDPKDAALLHFTSGTTGKPKGVIHAHQAVLTHYVTGKYVLDFHRNDIFWCTADPGWVTGTSYGIIAPLVQGITNLIVEPEFDARLWYHLLEKEKVSIWYTSPTAIRRLMRLDIDVLKEYHLRKLRLIHSVGEPLNPEAVRWATKTFKMPILDNWWQTETGGIMIANYASMPVKPGSMGKPIPGIKAAIVQSDDSKQGKVHEAVPNEVGELALEAEWPSMFRGYLNDDKRYQACFKDGWYLTGDLARVDDDGYFWFVGRSDDIIKSAGHMVSPFEVESVLIEHQAVAEAAVYGKPDTVMGELVKAVVVLKSSFSASEDLLQEIKGYARERLGPSIAPREIQIAHELPKTQSGKIMRRLLRDKERDKLQNV